MSNFWSFYIIALVALNIGGCAWLLLWTRRTDNTSAEDGTTGHEYDGIREYNNPLPRWWLMLFWITIFFGLVYLVAYPGLGKFQGILGWSSKGELAIDEKAYQDQYGTIYANYAKTPIETLAKDAQAMKIASRLFANNCSTCHGTDAHGARGFPNLSDKDWLYGGEPERIQETIMEGRNGIMPPWQSALGDTGVKQVANYVRSLSGLKSDSTLTAAGHEIFASKCFACHGADGKGNTMMGAPDLTDKTWLYGSSEATLIKTIGEGRAGHMPTQKDNLGVEKVHLLAAYIWSLSKKQQDDDK